jgi:hypothetical protein
VEGSGLFDLTAFAVNTQVDDFGDVSTLAEPKVVEQLVKEHKILLGRA